MATANLCALEAIAINAERIGHALQLRTLHPNRLASTQT